jgi:hypothetical protein
MQENSNEKNADAIVRIFNSICTQNCENKNDQNTQTCQSVSSDDENSQSDESQIESDEEYNEKDSSLILEILLSLVRSHENLTKTFLTLAEKK